MRSYRLDLFALKELTKPSRSRTQPTLVNQTAQSEEEIPTVDYRKCSRASGQLMGTRVTAEQTKSKREGGEMETSPSYRVVRGVNRCGGGGGSGRGGAAPRRGEAAVEAKKRLCVWGTPKGPAAHEGRLAFHGPSMQYSSGPVAL